MTAARTLIDDPWLDAHEAATYLRLSESRVRDLARSGELREDGRGPSGIRRVGSVDFFPTFTATCEIVAGPLLHE